MKKFKTLVLHGSLSIMLVSILLSYASCRKSIDPSVQAEPEAIAKTPKVLKDFEQVTLVANREGYNANRVDPNLGNAWGIAWSSNGIAWIGAQAGHVSTVYNQFGADVRPAVAIPSPGGPTGGNPTGVVFSASNTDFILSNGQAARFMFVGVDGIISGWNAAAGNTALLIKNNVATSAYTGLAIASNNGSNFIYAADFRAGRIDVYDRTFVRIMNMPFIDPNIPAGYSPFNIEKVADKLYVMYAKVGPDGRDEPAPGAGYVSVFNTDGSFVKRFLSKGQLNAPWGIAKAPAGFWGDGSENPADVILVGNFGDGRINAFSGDGDFLGQLRQHGNPIIIDGLWAISFAPTTATAIDPNKLFFAAGPNHEQDGLFGYITK